MEVQWHHSRIGKFFIKISWKIVLRLCMGHSTCVPEIFAAFLPFFHFLLIVLNRSFNFLSPHGLESLKDRVIAAGILSLRLIQISGGMGALMPLDDSNQSSGKTLIYSLFCKYASNFYVLKSSSVRLLLISFKGWSLGGNDRASSNGSMLASR